MGVGTITLHNNFSTSSKVENALPRMMAKVILKNNCAIESEGNQPKLEQTMEGSQKMLPRKKKKIKTQINLFCHIVKSFHVLKKGLGLY